MKLRFRLLVLSACGLLVVTGPGRADEAPKPDLKPLTAEVRKLVEKHYPKAKITVKDQTIHFEFNTRKFMIHERTWEGEWRDAFEEVGPQKGGIVGEIELCDGQYGGMAYAPQAFDKRYFTTWLLAPYSKKLDQHLYIHLKYPRDVPKEFLKEFDQLVDEFDKHVPVPKR